MLESAGWRAERRGAAVVVPRLHDPYYRAWLARRTLAEWRAADAVLRRSQPSSARDMYERCVAMAQEHLGRFASIEALVEHHTVDRFRRLGDGGPPPAGTVEAWLADVCAPTEGAPVLDQQLVIGAAFWRRAQELIGRPAQR